LEYMLDEAVSSGNSKKLEQAVVCTHRLKSAVPAANLARMGAIVGGGTSQQVEKLGEYFEAIGVAFQIIDDVLNLRGFQGNTKHRGEDLMVGKVTYPVAKAMSRLNLQDRTELKKIIISKPENQTIVDQLIDKFEEVGAIEACVVEAKEMVDTAWTGLHCCIPSSFYKALLRAFGLYVLDRHY